MFGLAYSVSSGSRVFCVGDEGHSKIEQAMKSCCVQDTSLQSEGALTSDAHEDDECGDCADIEVTALFTTRLNGESSYDLLPSHFTPVCYIDSKPLISVTSPEENDNSRSFNLTLSLLIITTTVLIC